MPTMSAVGVLCKQYLHAGRADPVIVGGVRFLMANLPDDQKPATSTTGTTPPKSCTTWPTRIGTPGTARCARFW